MISYHERRKGGGAERAKRSPLKKNATALAVIQSIFLHQRRQAPPPSRSTPIKDPPPSSNQPNINILTHMIKIKEEKRFLYQYYYNYSKTICTNTFL